VLPAPVQGTCPDSEAPDRSVRAPILVRQEPDEEDEEEDHNDVKKITTMRTAMTTAIRSERRGWCRGVQILFLPRVCCIDDGQNIGSHVV
jgi:hypothetical protein